MEDTLDTSQIKSWRSIVTLIVFILTNITVLFPFKVPLYIPRPVSTAVLGMLSNCRVISPRPKQSQRVKTGSHPCTVDRYVRLEFPMNFVTAPLVADLFLLAISAIGRQEVHDGTVGSNNISPLDIMAFFLTLAYIAISIDASGLIRYLAFQVLKKGGKVGHWLFFYLYTFFFCLGTFIGNDPIILSGTAFLAYMTRVSKNIMHPRAWIVSQFAVANTASAILVSSNPTNLVLAGAFKIKFITYTANMIVPVVATAIVLFPFLLYVVFADSRLIPESIQMRDLPNNLKGRERRNPNIPYARGTTEEEDTTAANAEKGEILLLEEIMNPFLDKKGAAFGAMIMAVTLITLLALNAASQSQGEYPVFWGTLPAACIMFCWDVAFGFMNRKITRKLARQTLWESEADRSKPAVSGDEYNEKGIALVQEEWVETSNHQKGLQVHSSDAGESRHGSAEYEDWKADTDKIESGGVIPASRIPTLTSLALTGSGQAESDNGLLDTKPIGQVDVERSLSESEQQRRERPTLVCLVSDGHRWCQETLPTVTAVVAHLPFMLVPFAFSMFVLVQALVTRGWVPVFAHGWDHWVNKTGTIGSIGGMGLLSVILCNFAGTNIGSTILLSRVIQAWQEIHVANGTPLSNRTFWATVYSMALGVNFGAYSMAFSASLAGLLWRDILARKHINVSRLEFAWWNVPIIALAMGVGCAVLVAEVYIVRDDSPYHSG
ncbi:hypothetical protein ABEF95_008576 [Exophiala dermatitidis]